MNAALEAANRKIEALQKELKLKKKIMAYIYALGAVFVFLFVIGIVVCLLKGF